MTNICALLIWPEVLLEWLLWACRASVCCFIVWKNSTY